MFDNISGNNIGYYQGLGTGGDTITKVYRDAMVLSGHRDAPLVRCSISNINFHFNGGGSLEDNKVILPEVNDIPNPSFMATPAYGIITRNTYNLKMSNINLTYEGEDKRSAIIIENGTNTILSNVNVQSDGVLPAIKWYGGVKPFINNCSKLIENNIISISGNNSDIMELKKAVFVEN